MKVVFVLATTDLGGAEKQAIILSNEFIRKKGIESLIFFISGKNNGKAIEFCDMNDVPFYIMGKTSKNVFCRLFYFFRDIRRLKPDVLLPYTAIPNKYCSLIWRFTNSKCCIWNQRDQGIGMNNTSFYNKLLFNVSCIICNSESSKKYLTNNFNLRKHIYVVENGLIVNDNFVDVRSSINENSFVILMVANITNFKDHCTLLRAFHLFLKQAKSKLLLAGSFGNSYETVHSLAQELNIIENIEFLGYVDNLEVLYQQADLFVLSSKSEGLPNSVIEAMQHSLPVLGTDIEAIRNIICEENRKYLTNIEDYIGLFENMILFYHNKELRHQIGIRNRNFVANKYSLEEKADSTLFIINKFLNK
jgi:glycosyltransferase involved in cell wall biosynthesis